uniref:Glycosyltransferase 61 catalytic domain-containing protein n=1 Tax=Physcomitrium patens TaxID=3218 RepID=A0A2K1JRX8_PHYPA|nr:hypothetical protein PHYPA_016671 [Physcomitrium patens]
MRKHKEGGGIANRLRSNINGTKRELGWKMIYIVSAMAWIGLLQLVVVEHPLNPWFHQSATTAPIFKETSSSHLSSEANSSLKRSNTLIVDVETSTPRVQIATEKPGVFTIPPALKSPKNVNLLKFNPENTFLPLKDVKESGLSDTDTNWFMSGLRWTPKLGNGETFDLPKDDSKGRILCVRGRDMQDGTKNGYGLFKKRRLPRGAIFREHTTFIADNYWDYNNPWHSMSALANFITWRLENSCSTPDRLLLYHAGELVTSMGPWISHVMQAAFMKFIPIETLESTHGSNSPVCFERAVIQRRGLGKVDKVHINAAFDVLRCKARAYCGVKRSADRSAASVEVLLFMRTGPRSFQNETAVANTVRSECAKYPSCNMRVVNSANLTFCEQVEVMTNTDVLVTVHGAQMTNMMFMEPGSRVMEMFPKGWLELAGVGQEIYKWHADWTRVIHAGRWRDPEGPECPYPRTETLECFLFFKDRQVGLNATFLADWMGSVLRDFGMTTRSGEQQDGVQSDCACDMGRHSFTA